MNETVAEIQETPPAKPKRRKYVRRAAAPPKPPKPANIFAGITPTQCPTGCMKEGVCLISTVNVCKHPYMAGDAGCGPITMENRRKALKLLKHQKIDARG